MVVVVMIGVVAGKDSKAMSLVDIDLGEQPHPRDESFSNKISIRGFTFPRNEAKVWAMWQTMSPGPTFMTCRRSETHGMQDSMSARDIATSASFIC